MAGATPEETGPLLSPPGAPETNNPANKQPSSLLPRALLSPHPRRGRRRPPNRGVDGRRRPDSLRHVRLVVCRLRRPVKRGGAGGGGGRHSNVHGGGPGGWGGRTRGGGGSARRDGVSLRREVRVTGVRCWSRAALNPAHTEEVRALLSVSISTRAFRVTAEALVGTGRGGEGAPKGGCSSKSSPAAVGEVVWSAREDKGVVRTAGRWEDSSGAAATAARLLLPAERLARGAGGPSELGVPAALEGPGARGGGRGGML